MTNRVDNPTNDLFNLVHSTLSARFGGHWDMLSGEQQSALRIDAVDMHQAEGRTFVKDTVEELARRLGFDGNPAILGCYADVMVKQIAKEIGYLREDRSGLLCDHCGQVEAEIDERSGVERICDKCKGGRFDLNK